jgi:uncharacterized LabA/DUF88 family protein
MDIKKERVAIFIDGSNLYHSLRNSKVKEIDFQKLIKFLVKERLLIGVFYYNAPLDISIDENKYWEMQRFFEMLRKLPGFNVILCRRKKYTKEDGTLGFEMKGDDVHLAIDMVSGAYENLYDTAIIVSGDEDFVPLIKKLQKLRKRVENAYFTKSSSNALKNSSNYSICLNPVMEQFKLE